VLHLRLPVLHREHRGADHQRRHAGLHLHEDGAVAPARRDAHLRPALPSSRRRVWRLSS
ncbi:hypothetical protein AAFF_G00205130, partial [Aldrovandia affinis]